MKWKSFTPEEILTLRKNPYTLRVSEKTIAFTRVFKEQFWSGLQEGKSKFEILKEMGYDPEILGLSRVEGITYHIRKEAEEPEGFHEGRRTRAPYSLSTDSFAELQQAQALRHLQAEVLYLRQEIEFIKKSCKRRT